MFLKMIALFIYKIQKTCIIIIWKHTCEWGRKGTTEKKKQIRRLQRSGIHWWQTPKSPYICFNGADCSLIPDTEIQHVETQSWHQSSQANSDRQVINPGLKYWTTGTKCHLLGWSHLHTYASIVGIAYFPVLVSIAPFMLGSFTSIIKLLGIPVLFLILGPDSKFLSYLEERTKKGNKTNKTKQQKTTETKLPFIQVNIMQWCFIKNSTS